MAEAGREIAGQKIAELVERFRNTPKTQRDAYNEDQTRHYFILPLFRALGWDTENPAEFSAEEQISRGFVDFGFYLNGVPVFYLETKKVAERLEKPEFMRQAINYAFLKGVTWAVLTDFENLMVFNAEWEETDPLKMRFLNLSWEHYANEQFDDLWLLSKSSVQAREMDQVAERFGRKAKKEPVTNILFKQLTLWRRSLFDEMRTYSTTLWATDPHAVDNAVQKLLDRLIFIRTVEDRGVEGPRLQAVLRQSKNKDLFPNLLRLFRELDGVYNSNLFATSDIDRMEVHDPDLIRDIVDGLYRAPGGFVSYDFNAISADVLGAVYEQYLGFRAQDPEGRESLDPRKQEKRKKQGIYYTPQFVVRYIVQQTLGRLLNPPSGERPSAEQVHSLRILDPACGSGSFLIEAFDVLDRWLAQHGTEQDRLFPRQRRLRILQENLYGVDLDDQAVEVTRLNLMLRAALERGKLPLLTHIQHGNSLIDDPAVAGDHAFQWEERFPVVFAGRQRTLWFITFVTHNSRISERMVTYGIEAGEAVVFTPEEQILMAEKIAEACQKHGVPVVAWNVLPDHVHMVIGAEDESALNEIVRKIKGYSSYAFQRSANWESGQHVWAQKYHHQVITDETMLHAVVEYVSHNHEKHAADWGERLIRTWEGRTDTDGDQGLSGDQKPPDTEPNKGLSGGRNPSDMGPDQGLSGEQGISGMESNKGLSGGRDPSDTALNKGLSGGRNPSDTALNKGLKPLVTIVREICVSPEEAGQVPGGFDVVIGNPPYVRQETLGAEFKAYAAAHYETYAGTNDLYVYFIERGIKLLRSGGLFGIIVANKWLRANYGKALRQWLKTQAIEEIIDFGDLPVFQDATAYPCILVARAGTEPGMSGADSGDGNASFSVTVTQVKRLDFNSLDRYVEEHRYAVSRVSLEDKGWSLAESSASALLMKLKTAGVPLGSYVEGKIHFGIKTGLNEAFVIDEVTKERLIREDSKSSELIKPFLAGRDVKRYERPAITRYLILMPNGWTDATAAELSGRRIEQEWEEAEAWAWLHKMYPAIAGHVAPFAEAARRRWDKGEYWWELRPCAYYDAFERPKIIYAEIAARGQFALGSNPLYVDTTAYVLGTASGFLLGILNSRLWTFLFSQVSAQIRGGFYRWKHQYMENLPIRTIDFDDAADRARHDRMVALVEKMLRLKERQAAAERALSDERHTLAEQIEQTDREIDALVYELYGLTEGEIRVVEGG